MPLEVVGEEDGQTELPLSDRALDGLRKVAEHMGGRGEQRANQQEMCAAVADAVEGEHHLVVAAGTGTGKSLAYLLPLVLSDKRAVVATATKNLQDQLADKDLPLLRDALGKDFSFSVLKGRSNYICKKRLSDWHKKQAQQTLGGGDQTDYEIRGLSEWAETTSTGDRDELVEEPSTKAWAQVSVSAQECPGKKNCPQGEECFTERARDNAAESDVVVTNMHLYCHNMSPDSAVLPEHDLVVLDEAHGFADIAADCFGAEFSVPALRRFASLKAVRDLPEAVRAGLLDAARHLSETLEENLDPGQPLPRPLPDDMAAVAEICERAIRAAHLLLAARCNKANDKACEECMAEAAAKALAEDLAAVSNPPEDSVAWVENENTWKSAPLLLRRYLDPLWQDTPTVVLASATIPSNLRSVLGLVDEDDDREERHRHEVADVGSPFDYEQNGLLYCPGSMPPPNGDDHGEWKSAVCEELEALMDAAGGRTLALFSSISAMRETAEQLRARTWHRILLQGESPRPVLLEDFAEDTDSSLFATISFWQGVDVPGPSLSLVAINRIPFPTPSDTLMNARKERYEQQGEHGWAKVWLPRAETMLAQGVGRLIRTTTDSGVVAVLDSRLATKGYGKRFRNYLPPFRYTQERSEAEAMLRTMRER